MGTLRVGTSHPEARQLHSASLVAWMWRYACGGVKSESGCCSSSSSGFISQFLHSSHLGSQVLPGCGISPGLLLWGFCRGKTCWVGVKSCRDCVFTTGLQEPNSLQHMGNCFCKGRFAALPGAPGSGLPGHPLVLLVPPPSRKGLPFGLSSLHPSLQGQL